MGAQTKSSRIMTKISYISFVGLSVTQFENGVLPILTLIFTDQDDNQSEINLMVNRLYEGVEDVVDMVLSNYIKDHTNAEFSDVVPVFSSENGEKIEEVNIKNDIDEYLSIWED